MTVLEQFEILVKAQGAAVEDENLKAALFLRAESDFKALCNREEIPRGAESILAEIMLIHYNRIGAEGEISRKEGDIQYRLDSTLPAALLNKLRKYNLCKVI